MNKISAIIWDWNGTILNDAKISMECCNELCRKYGLEEVTVEKYREIFTFPVKVYYELLGFNFEIHDFQLVSKEYIESYKRNIKHVELYPGIVETFAVIKSKGIKQYILSAMENNMLIEMTEYMGIKQWFDDIQGIENIYAESKVGSGVKLLERANIKCIETIMIGDSLHDKEVANELNITPILVASGHFSKSRLEKAQCLIFDNPNIAINQLLNK